MKQIPMIILKKTISLMIVLLCASTFSINAQCRLLNDTFDVNPVLSPGNVDGTWYPDRYRPAEFISNVLASSNVLKISINGTADGALGRGAQGSSFYNTQGRKFNQCGGCVTVLKGDLWISADWATKHRRTDMWATARNAINANTVYPIIGFRNPDGASPGIYYWDPSVGWINSLVPVVYDSWYNLEFRIVGPNIVYYVNGSIVGTISSNSSTYFGDIIMQAYNFNDAAMPVSHGTPDLNPLTNSYDAYWDNLVTTGTGGKVVTNINTGQTFCSIQPAIDAANPGDHIKVGPGNYFESASNRSVFSVNGPHKFGLFIDKDNLTLEGLDASNNTVTSAGNAAAVVTTNATNNFGSSGIFVQANGVTIKGLKIGDNFNDANVRDNNKTIEVAGNGFTLDKTWISTFNDEGAIYMGRWDAAHPISSYSLTQNKFENTLVSINNGVGLTGPRAGRVITGNEFVGVATPYLIGFRGWNGAGPVQGWIVAPVGGAVVTGNLFNTTGVDKYVVARGNAGGYINSQLDWSEIWNLNTYGNHVVTLMDYPTFDVRPYVDGAGYPVTRRISPGIQENESIGQTGDVVLVAPGTYPETLTISKSITILGPNAAINPNVDGDATIVNPARVAEAIIKPVTNSGAMILSGANALNVVIKGFTIDRDNGTANDARFMDLINRTGNVWTFENNTFQNAPATINGYFYLTGTTTGMNFTFNQNRFTGNGNSNGLAFWGSNPTIVSVTNNVWYNNMGWAVNSNSIQGTISGNSFVEDRISAADIPNFSNYQNGVLFANIDNNISLTANVFKKVHIGMYLYRHSPFSGIVNATENIFDQAFMNGVRVLPGASNPDLTNVSVNNNAFLSGSNIEATGQTMTLNATCNWYGTTNNAVIASKISGPVTYMPYLTNGTDNSAATGFQPVPGSCNGSNVLTITCPANVSVQCASAVPAVNVGSVTKASGTCPSFVVSHIGDVISNWTCANRYTITRTYQATDACGNTATCSQTITVNDQTPPTINCPSNITVSPTTLAGTVVTYTLPVITDNCSGGVLVRTAGLASGSTFPIGTTTVTHMVTDACGLTASCSFTVTVINPYCDNKKKKAYVCHSGTTLCVSIGDVQSHLNHGDYLGQCTTALRSIVIEKPVTDEFKVNVSPNPSVGDFRIQVISNSMEPISVKVMDLFGKVLTVNSSIIKGSIVLGNELRPGTYIAEVIQGASRQVIKLVKVN